MAKTMTKIKVNVDKQWKPFVNGQFVSGMKNRTLINPADGKPLCTVEEAGPAQVEAAIASARNAFDHGPWSKTTAHERATYLFKLADLIDSHQEELSQIETLNGGKPIRESAYDIADSANCFRYYAGLITKPLGETVEVPAASVTSIVREPIGVCAQIIPWNFPLLMAAWKLAPALAAGNTCILKPSEYTPLSALYLAELIQKSGLPEGVVNILTGDGPTVGLPLAESKLVDKVAFTGSVKTGKIIAQAALSNLKKVSLELGGKSPMIVFPDFDLDTAVDYALFAIYCNAGQVCSAGSRMIVDESIYDRFIEKMSQRAKKIAIGKGISADTEMGPLVNEVQFKRVLEYIKIGQEEGAKLVCGGKSADSKDLAGGYYIEPTIFSDVSPDMRIVQEEIFGPVVVVQKFSGEQEAIDLANQTDYGLAAAVFTNDVSRSYRVIKALKAGITWINGYHFTYNECPWGGYKQSGWGRELGTYGLDAYMEVKQINLNLQPGPIQWFQ
jgi:betaine-aldehyde dehydrogenase